MNKQTATGTGGKNNTVTLDALVNYAAMADAMERKISRTAADGSDNPAAKLFYTKSQGAISIISDFFFQGNRWDAMDYIEKNGHPETIQPGLESYFELCQ